MNTRIGIRLSIENRELLEKAAQQSGFENLSDYIRKVLEDAVKAQASNPETSRRIVAQGVKST
jgi:uncharacterized protein (DUF1778 family)